MALIDTIRAQYPNPRRTYHDEHTPDSYCVGAALCRYAGLRDAAGGTHIRFPHPALIIKALTLLNPRLALSEAAIYTTDIMYENDTGHFEAAWTEADKALTQIDKED